MNLNVSDRPSLVFPGLAVTGIEENGFIYIHKIMIDNTNYNDIVLLTEFFSKIPDNVVICNIRADDVQELLFSMGFVLGEFSDELGMLQEGFARPSVVRNIPGYFDHHEMETGIY